MTISQTRYRPRDLPWSSSPSREGSSSAGSTAGPEPAEAFRPAPDWPDRHASLCAQPGSVQTKVLASRQMKGCIVTQELREIRFPPPHRAARLCSLAEMSPDYSESSSPAAAPITPLLLTHSPDVAEVSTSSSARSHSDSLVPRSVLPFKKGVITDEEVHSLKIDPRRLRCYLDSSLSSPSPSQPSNAQEFPGHGHSLRGPLPPIDPASRKRRRSHVEYPTTHGDAEGVPLIPSAVVSVGPGAIVPATNGYRVLDRPAPLDLRGQSVLLLGMVYANEKRRLCEGQGMRDTLRIVALEEHFRCQVYTVDKTHPERVGYVTGGGPRHVQTNFNDPRRMLSSFQEAWGAEGRKQFHLIALDYFRSPAGWSETNWSRTFFDHTLPALCTEGWMPSNGRLILPNTTWTMDGVLASDDLQACFHVAVLQDPNDNPLWAATRALETDGKLYDMSGHYTNDTERRHLDEAAPFIQLTPIEGMCGSKVKKKKDPE